MATHKEARAALDDVLKALALNKRTSQRNKKTLDLLLKGLTETMKEVDPLFRKLYQRLAYTGSMYQKLRIFNPDEFDIDIVLFFPLPKGCASPEIAVAGPRWGSVELTKAHLGYLKENLGVQAFHQLKKLVNEEGRVLVPRCLQWFQSVVDKARQRYKPPPSEDGADSFTLKVSSANPAITLHVTLACGDKFDVDLVPVSEWDYTQLPEGLDLPEWAHKYCSKTDKWVTVPKRNIDDDCAWRIHFKAIENKLIEDVGGCAKSVIRLVKALKEKYKWNLSSYACKTVVMRHIVAKPRRSDWDHKHLFTRLLEVLDRMRMELLAEGPGIRYLFDERMSLTARVDETTRRNIAGFLQNKIDQLEEAPETAPEIFLPRSCSSSDCGSTSDGIGQRVKRNKRGLKRTSENCAPESFSADGMEVPPRKRRAVSDTADCLDGMPEGMEEKATSTQRGAGNADAAASTGPVTLRPTSQRSRGHGRRSSDQSGTNGARVKQETREAPGTEDHGAVKNHAGIDAEPEDNTSFLLRLLSHLRSTPARMRARAQMQLLDIASSYSQGKYPKELLVNKSRDN